MLAFGQSDASGIGAGLPRNVEAVDAKGAIGQRIKQARLEAGLAQVEVAERCGVSRAAVSNWELGQGSGAKGSLNMRMLSAYRA
jgi:DNA-binding transcriptional regulator YiaG